MSLVIFLLLFTLKILVLRYCFGAKTATLHFCLAGRIYWRFDVIHQKVNANDTVHIFLFGPVSFQVVT